MANIDNSTRDLAVRAMNSIENHMRVCDARYGEWKARQDKTNDYLEGMTKQMGEMQNQMSEAKGAGKMAKMIGGLLSSVLGFAGGAGSHLLIK